MSEQITQDEWLAELERLGTSDGDEGRTVEEIGEALGHSGRWVRKRLKAGLKAGTIARGHGQRERLDGIMTTVPVYRAVKQ